MKTPIAFQLKCFALILSIAALQSCASIFAPKNQRVTISKGKGSKLQINGQKPLTKKGKYIFNKNDIGTQVTATKEGYKDENKVFGTHKNHILKYVLSIPLSIPWLGLPLLLDKGPKSKRYDSEFEIGKNMVLSPIRQEGDKELKINNVSADVEAEDIKQRLFYTFKKYYRKEDKKDSKTIKGIESIDVKNTIFLEQLNETLKNSGFIDTTKKALKNSYANNLLLNANIVGVTFHRVTTKMLYTDVIIDWEVLDYYKNSIYEITTESRSGEFTTLNDGGIFKETVNTSINDALDYALIDFLSDEKIKSLLQDNSVAEKEKSFLPISLPKSANYVKTVSEAINSGVTIKNNNSHGSGFLISPDGHIITNYHVIAGNKDMKVVLNDGKEYEFEVIRESRVHDLALLKIDAKGLRHFTISPSRDIEIGNTVYAIGTPSSTSLSQSISKGIISGVRDNDNKAKQIQTDVSVNGGNSGGALINKQGVVIGVVSSKLIGIGVEGVGFGIPAYEIFDRLKLE